MIDQHLYAQKHCLGTGGAVYKSHCPIPLYLFLQSSQQRLPPLQFQTLWQSFPSALSTNFSSALPQSYLSTHQIILIHTSIYFKINHKISPLIIKFIISNQLINLSRKTSVFCNIKSRNFYQEQRWGGEAENRR